MLKFLYKKIVYCNMQQAIIRDQWRHLELMETHWLLLPPLKNMFVSKLNSENLSIESTVIIKFGNKEASVKYFV